MKRTITLIVSLVALVGGLFLIGSGPLFGQAAGNTVTSEVDCYGGKVEFRDFHPNPNGPPPPHPPGSWGWNVILDGETGGREGYAAGDWDVEWDWDPTVAHTWSYWAEGGHSDGGSTLPCVPETTQVTEPTPTVTGPAPSTSYPPKPGDTTTTEPGVSIPPDPGSTTTTSVPTVSIPPNCSPKCPPKPEVSIPPDPTGSTFPPKPGDTTTTLGLPATR